jgi:spermidine/putrescine transport system ATP-binding protein
VMNEGRTEQLGDCEDVYELPATEFVASFLGASNLLDGQIESVNGGIAKVRLDEGTTIALPSGRLPARSGSIRIGVRPEKLHLRKAGDDLGPGANSIEALVTISTYTGVSTSYECRTSDGSIVVVYVQNLGESVTGAAGGERVRLSWDPDHTFAVAQSDGDKKEEQIHGGP